jgi:hypothetical protein
VTTCSACDVQRLAMGSYLKDAVAFNAFYGYASLGIKQNASVIDGAGLNIFIGATYCSCPAGADSQDSVGFKTVTACGGNGTSDSARPERDSLRTQL